MVQISIQDTTRESKVMVFTASFWFETNLRKCSVKMLPPSFLQTCYGTNNPIWSDAFTFFIQDPRKQDIDIQVSSIGCFRIVSPACSTHVCVCVSSSSGERR